MNRRRPDWWTGLGGDVLAAAVVLLGGGALGWIGLGGRAGIGVDLPIFGAAPIPRFGEPPEMGPGGSREMIPETLPVVGLLILACAVILMFLRRRWPIPVFGAAFLFVIVSILIGFPPLGAGIAVTIAAYAVAYRVRRRTALFIAAAAVLVILVLSFAVTGWSSFDTRVFQIAAGIAIAAALGDSARSRREYLSAAEDRAERAERTREAEAEARVAEERLRIARDLHDTVAHQISVISLNAGVASGALRGDPEKAEASLHSIRSASRGALAEIGDLLRYLRAEEPDSAPQPGFEQVEELVQRMSASGMAIELQVVGDPGRVGETAGLTVYRVLQEALTNAHKHGAEQRASARIEIGDDAAQLRVENPSAEGDTLDTASNGLGLVGIRERVSALGGRVATTEQEGLFVLDAWIPLADAEVSEVRS